MKRILINVAFATAVTVLIGCGSGGSSDGETSYVEGKVFYSNGALFGATKSESPAIATGINLFDVNGDLTGFIDNDGVVIDLGGNVIDICVGTFNENGILAGECTMPVLPLEDVPTQTGGDSTADDGDSGSSDTGGGGDDDIPPEDDGVDMEDGGTLEGGGSGGGGGLSD